MTTCSKCSKWVRERRRHYSDGTEISCYQAPNGKGHCEVLALDTPDAFGCNQFVPDISATPHIDISYIEGTPWEHWTVIPCPECEGKGSSHDHACRACEGTGHTRRYDDGHVAKWDHPLEKERKKANAEAERRMALAGTTLTNVHAAKEGGIASTSSPEGGAP